MSYNLYETKEAVEDVIKLATYMIEEFKNPKAALDFLEKHDREAVVLKNFPFGYRGISFEYLGYEIRLKPFNTYNIFFVVDVAEKKIIILRVLKDRQDWKIILGREQEYHFG